MNAEFVRIPCSISKGMFGNEYAVEIELADGGKVSFFADKDIINNIDSTHTRGYIKVMSVGDQNGVKKVLLPCEAFESGSRWADVDENALQIA
jgi:hypothetical protein